MNALDIKQLIVGQLQTNCYLIIDPKAQESIIIDPGDDADYVIRIIQDEKVTPTKIIATHGHFDHILSVLELKLAFNIPFYANLKDEFLIKTAKKRAEHFLPNQADLVSPIDHNLTNKTIIKVGDSDLKVIETPGHTPGSICLYNKELKILFSGDTLFKEGVGRTDLSYSSNADLIKSLKRISSLSKNTTIYPGHGDSTILGKEIIYLTEIGYLDKKA